MQEADAQKIPVERVARTGQAWLELKGTILLFHTHSWISTNSIFIPMEWIGVEHHRRRDFRRLWLGILSLMVGMLFALPAKVLLLQHPLPEGDEYLVTAFVGCAAVCCLLGCAALLRFAFPRSFTQLKVAATPMEIEIQFWHRPGAEPRLDLLVDKLENQQGPPEEADAFPIRMHHLWRRPRPYRIAFMQGFAVSALVYPLLALWDLAAMYGRAPDFNRLYYLLLALPPLTHLSAAIIRGGHRWREPRAYRDAVRYYLHNRNEDAEMALRCLLARKPEHDAGRFLLVQIYTERYEFDLALEHIKKLDLQHPLLASRLQANLWSLRRMHSRMVAAFEPGEDGEGK